MLPSHSGCKRCDYINQGIIKRARKNPCKGLTQDHEFYCDVGVKSVLRSIRRSLLKLLIDIKEINLGVDRQELKNASVEFFRDYLTLDDSDINNDDALAIIEVFLDCVMDKPKGCALRR